jgi:hypothetical protein
VNRTDIILLMAGVGLMGMAILSYLSTEIITPFQILVLFALGFALAGRSVVRDLEDHGL